MADSPLNDGAGLHERVAGHLQVLYPGSGGAGSELGARVIEAFGITDPGAVPGRPEFSADEVVLITYGDSLVDDRGTPPLQLLASFLDRHLDDVISTVHVLPFTESSSDGGFSVVDYNLVAQELGDWDDVAAVAGSGAGRRLMADLILNHGSAQSEWFRQFRAGESPGRDYYMTADPAEDLSTVVRPRTHPLLQEIETPDGARHAWCTFSFDQVDFDFSNPDVLVEFCRIVDHYVRRGVTRLRLDAVAYVWKQLGTSSIHLPQTHELVRLFHTLLAYRSPDVMLITETNVPHAENVSYFGARDEAHVVYNFSLVPLVLHSLLTGNADALSDWATSTPPIPSDTAYLNFLASHDGMGVRPAQGLLSHDEIQNLVEASRATGGTFSPYATPEGELPYELNASLSDLLAHRDLRRLDRYVCAHAIMLAFAGIPAIYVHSLLATPGDIASARATGIKRNINRSRLDIDALESMLDDPAEPRTQAFQLLSELIRIRRAQPAFAPGANQHVLSLGPSVFGLRREATGAGGQQVIYALHNVTHEPVEVRLDALDAHGDNWRDDWSDLVSGDPAVDSVVLGAWQAAWLTNG